MKTELTYTAQVPELNVYRQYVMNYPSALDVMNRAMQLPDFVALLEVQLVHCVNATQSLEPHASLN